MLNKVDERNGHFATEVVAGGSSHETQDEFERLRAVLLDDTLARLRLLEAENLRLQRENERLWGENEASKRRHERLLDELAKLRLKIEDKESFTSALEPVIADTLERKIATSGEEMAVVVAPLMAPAIKQQIHDSKDEMVEALHPIIGQTVKRAVTEAMRKLIREINQRLDRAFNMQSTWRRLKAKLTGVPEPLAVLPQILPFTVEDVFLISRKDGLLMTHVSAHAQNEDTPRAQMMSGMLTAIQDFIKDVYRGGDTGDMQVFKDGDRISFIMASPLVCLAVVTATPDEPPSDFSEQVERLLNKIQNTCHRAIVAFSGNTEDLAAARPFIKKFMHSFEAKPQAPAPKAHASSSRAVKIAWGMLGAAALALLAWFIFKPTSQSVLTTPALEATVGTLASGTMPFRLEARMKGEVWMRVFDNGSDSTAFKDFRFQPGEVYAWRASESIRMRLGNAGETELYLDGNNLGELGAVHEPVTLVISRDGILQKN